MIHGLSESPSKAAAREEEEATTHAPNKWPLAHQESSMHMDPNSTSSFFDTDAPSLALSDLGGRDTAGIEAESSAVATKAAVSASVALGLCMALL